MKIKNNVSPIYLFVDTMNSLSWFSAAMIITLVGLSVLWAMGAVFIVSSL